MKRWLTGIAVALTVAGCGGATKTVTQTVTTPIPLTSPKAAAPAVKQPAPASCLKGQAFMGCAAPKAPPRLALAAAPAGRYFPDVSSWQGHPNWDAARTHIAAAVAKLGEYSLDPDVAYNVAAFKRLSIPYAVYWFVRPTGCQHEGGLILAYARQLGVKKIILDEETNGIAGYAACLDPYVVKATGQHADVYRSSGNNFDSSAPSLPCWVAAYGPSSAPSCDARQVVAFQFTDGRFGFPIYIPGIGQGDVSVDYKMFAAPIPPKPKPKPPVIICNPSARAMPNACLALFPNRRFGPARLNERGVASTYKYHRKSSVQGHLVYLRDRIWFVAHHKRAHGVWVKLPTADWSSHRAFRFQRFARDVAGR